MVGWAETLWGGGKVWGGQKLVPPAPDADERKLVPPATDFPD